MIQNNLRNGRPFLLSVLLFLFGSFCFAAENDSQPRTKPTPPPIRKPEPELPATSEKIPDWQARWELARVLSYAKKYEESIMEYEKLLKEKPDLLSAKIELAQILYWHNKHDKSFAIIKAIDSKNLNDESRLLLADLYAVRKEYDKAESIYRAHIKKKPTDTTIRLKLADLLSWQKKYEESLAFFRDLVKENPNNIQLRRRYAFVLIWDGQHEKGAEELKKTLRDNKKDKVKSQKYSSYEIDKDNVKGTDEGAKKKHATTEKTK